MGIGLSQDSLHHQAVHHQPLLSYGAAPAVAPGQVVGAHHRTHPAGNQPQ